MARLKTLPLIAAALLVAAAAFVGKTIYERDRLLIAEADAMTGGKADRGPALIRSYGCGGCHVIPGVAGAHGLVGPPLTRIRARIYIAGREPNSPDVMVRWLMDPKAIDARTAMPKTGLSDAEARDVAAYLYTLK